MYARPNFWRHLLCVSRKLRRGSKGRVIDSCASICFCKLSESILSHIHLSTFYCACAKATIYVLPVKSGPVICSGDFDFL